MRAVVIRPCKQRERWEGREGELDTHPSMLVRRCIHKQTTCTPREREREREREGFPRPLTHVVVDDPEVV